MGGKPVHAVRARSVVNFQSGFGHKRLCDGLTFSTGSACVFSCAFCYVGAIMSKSPHLAGIGRPLEEVVIRRAGALDALAAQLDAARRGRGRHAALWEPREKPLVIYASPLVDVAANLELAAETLAACKIILERTPWTIRLLSKSHLLPRIAAGIPPQWKGRVVYGVSTGTLDDALARSFEQGAALVSKRLASLRALQDGGHRTFGMICPSLPLPQGREAEGYAPFAGAMATAIRADRCEEVWAEVINVRGRSMTRTVNALLAGGFPAHAAAVAAVGTDHAAWERYARETFLAHAPFYEAAPGKLHFLQYVNRDTAAWWQPQAARGAVLLGRAAAGQTL